MTKQGDGYIIDWIDSVSHGAWTTQDDINHFEPEANCQSLGYYVKETKKFVVLALNRDTSGQNAPFGQFISIPKVAILRQKKVKV